MAEWLGCWQRKRDRACCTDPSHLRDFFAKEQIIVSVCSGLVYVIDICSVGNTGLPSTVWIQVNWVLGRRCQ